MVNMSYLTRRVIFLVLFLLMSFSVIAQETVRSYYVRADGDDNNNGRTEETPYATLRKAVEMAASGAIKRITVIGTIRNIESIGNAGSAEIVITGKPDALDEEKAVFTGTDGSYPYHVISISGPIRLEHIEISGGNGLYGAGLNIYGIVTIGKGVVIKDNNSSGVWVQNGTLIMCDDAIITNNTTSDGAGGGVSLNDGKLIMRDNAVISNNRARSGGGVSHGGDRSSIQMLGNSKITNNFAEGNGGGISSSTSADFKNIQLISLEGNASISNNTANSRGGGIYFSYSTSITTRQPQHLVPFRITPNVTINDNTAKEGGGLYIYYEDINPFVLSGGIITGNKAEYGAGIYYEGKANTIRPTVPGPYGETITINGGTITTNNAEFVGGGLYLKKGSQIIQTGRIITNNTAGDGDGEDIFKQE
jgi:hypothetical protein